MSGRTSTCDPTSIHRALWRAFWRAGRSSNSRWGVPGKGRRHAPQVAPASQPSPASARARGGGVGRARRWTPPERPAGRSRPAPCRAGARFPAQLRCPAPFKGRPDEGEGARRPGSLGVRPPAGAREPAAPKSDAHRPAIRPTHVAFVGAALASVWRGVSRARHEPRPDAPYGRAIVMTGEVHVSQCAGLLSSPSALSTEIFTTYPPFGTV